LGFISLTLNKHNRGKNSGKGQGNFKVKAGKKHKTFSRKLTNSGRRVTEEFFLGWGGPNSSLRISTIKVVPVISKNQSNLYLIDYRLKL
jgi:hypothetical protein